MLVITLDEKAVKSFLNVVQSIGKSDTQDAVCKSAALSYKRSVVSYIESHHLFPLKQTNRRMIWIARDGSGGYDVIFRRKPGIFLEYGTGLYGPNPRRYPIAPKTEARTITVRKTTKSGKRKYGKARYLTTVEKILVSVLRIKTRDGYIFRRTVHHPGIKARPFFFVDLENRKRTLMNDAKDKLQEKLGVA